MLPSSNQSTSAVVSLQMNLTKTVDQILYHMSHILSIEKQKNDNLLDLNL